MDALVKCCSPRATFLLGIGLLVASIACSGGRVRAEQAPSIDFEVIDIINLDGEFDPDANITLCSSFVDATVSTEMELLDALSENEAANEGNPEDSPGVCTLVSLQNDLVLSQTLQLHPGQLVSISGACGELGDAYCVLDAQSSFSHFIVELATLYLDNLVLRNGYSLGSPVVATLAPYPSDYYGGSIAAIGSRLNVQNARFESNTAFRSGGAIAAVAHSPSLDLFADDLVFAIVELYDVVFVNNSAEETGGIQPNWPDNCRGGAVFFVLGLGFGTNVTFDGNQAGTGGAVQVEGASAVEFVDATFRGNAALLDNGGGVSVESDNLFVDELQAIFLQSSFQCSQCAFDGNSAAMNGGALSCDGSIVVGDHLMFTNNTAAYLGGAASLDHRYSSGQAYALFEDTQFIENTADVGGGAISVDSQSIGSVLWLNLVRSAFAWNFAKEYGGAIAMIAGAGISNISDTLFLQNTATLGGGIYSDGLDVKTVTINNCTFFGCTCIDGGGMYIDDNGHFTITNSLFEQCTAVTHGGAVFIRNLGVNFEPLDLSSGEFSVTIQDSTLRNNSAESAGAAIYASNSVDFVLEGCTLESNYAASGAGLQLEASAIGALTFATVASCSFIGNIAYGSLSPGGEGGGVNVKMLSTAFATVNVTLLSSTFTGNAAGQHGGAIGAIMTLQGNDQSNFTITVDDCLIENNTATAVGGGIYLDAIMRTVLTSTTISHNSASELGGGIYLLDNNPAMSSADLFEATGLTVVGNSAYAGGGLYLGSRDQGLSAYVSDSKFQDNVATFRGGGICVEHYGATASTSMSIDTFLFDQITVQNSVSLYGTELYVGFRGVTLTDSLIGFDDLVEGPAISQPLTIVVGGGDGLEGCTEEQIVSVNLVSEAQSETPDLLVVLRGAGAYTDLNGITYMVDSTGPVCEGCVVSMTEALQTNIELLTFEFPHFDDDQTDVTFYDFFVGTTVGASNARQLTGFGIVASESCNIDSVVVDGLPLGTCRYSWNATESGLSLTPEYTYFVGVLAYNAHGLQSDTILSANGTFILRFCPLDFWLNISEDIDECKPCPPNMGTNRTGVISVDDCTCEAGFYRLASDDIVQGCRECPENAVCLGGQNYPFPEANFWSEYNEDVEPLMLDCERRGICDGGQDPATVCKDGYKGIKCTECTSGYSRVSGFCVKCDDGLHITQAFAVPLVLILWFILNKISELSVGADIMLSFFAETSLLLNIEVDFPQKLESAFYILTILAFQIDLVTPGCLTDWRTVSSFYLQALVPAIAAVSYALYFGALYLYSRWHLRRSKLSRARGQHAEVDEMVGEIDEKLPIGAIAFSNFRVSLLSFFSLLIVAMFETGVAPWRCMDLPSGDSFVWNFPEVVCGSSEHTAMRAVGGLLVASAFAYILWFGIFLHKAYKNDKLGDPDFISRWGFMYDDYKKEYVLWDVKLAVEKAALVASVVLFIDPFWQVFLSTTVSLLGTMWTAYAKPYRGDLDRFNHLATMLGIFQTYLFAISDVYDDPRVGSSVSSSFETASLVLLAFMLALAAYFGLLDLCKWAYFRMRNFRMTLRLLKKHPDYKVLKPRKYGVVPVVSGDGINLVNVRYAKHMPTGQIVLSTADSESVIDAFDPTPYFIWVQDYIRLYFRDGKVALQQGEDAELLNTILLEFDKSFAEEGSYYSQDNSSAIPVALATLHPDIVPYLCEADAEAVFSLKCFVDSFVAWLDTASTEDESGNLRPKRCFTSRLNSVVRTDHLPLLMKFLLNPETSQDTRAKIGHMIRRLSKPRMLSYLKGELAQLLLCTHRERMKSFRRSESVFSSGQSSQSERDRRLADLEDQLGHLSDLPGDQQAKANGEDFGEDPSILITGRAIAKNLDEKGDSTSSGSNEDAVALQRQTSVPSTAGPRIKLSSALLASRIARQRSFKRASSLPASTSTSHADRVQPGAADRLSSNVTDDQRSERTQPSSPSRNERID